MEKTANTAGWDQFAENERRFGVTTDYDENMYTTKIDKSHPKYIERMAHAEKMARAIERTAPTTSHVAEERIMDLGGSDQAGDEEEKYVSCMAGRPFPQIITTNRCPQIQRCP